VLTDIRTDGQTENVQNTQINTSYCITTIVGRRITVKKRRVTDSWLIEIGRRQPASLELVQCHGDAVTPTGLRELFRQCVDSLQVLYRMSLTVVYYI